MWVGKFRFDASKCLIGRLAIKNKVLLHCYPYEREAGYLAQAFNNVHLDVGLSVNHLGARAAAFVARLRPLLASPLSGSYFSHIR